MAARNRDPQAGNWGLSLAMSSLYLALLLTFMLAIEPPDAGFDYLAFYAFPCAAIAAVIVLTTVIAGNAYRQAFLDGDVENAFLVMATDDDQAPTPPTRLVARGRFGVRLESRPEGWRGFLVVALSLVVTFGICMAFRVPPVLSLVGVMPLLVISSFVCGYLFRQRVLDCGAVPRVPALNIRSRRAGPG